MSTQQSTSFVRCEIARNEPAADQGQACSAHRLAASSRSLIMAADLYVPFARAVVIGRASGLDGQIQDVVLYLPVYSAPTSDHRCAQGTNGVQRAFTVCGRDVHRSIFPKIPLTHLYLYTLEIRTYDAVHLRHTVRDTIRRY